MSIQLEVGKTYRGTCDQIRQILGVVEEGTYEYDEGMRFYDSIGISYTPEGRVSASRTSYLDLVEEVTKDSQILVHGKVDKLNYVLLDKIADKSGFIPSSSPDFRINLMSGLYVNRMGFLERGERMTHIYDQSGQRLNFTKSMSGIIYKVCDNFVIL